MATALFILGHAGAGKTRTAKRWVRSRLKKGESWAILDKDHCGEFLAPALMTALGMDPMDRDSPAFKANIRDLEYETCLFVAARQLRLGTHVVLPGPWHQEIASGRLFDVQALGFPEDTTLVHAFIDAPVEALRARILERGNPRDGWKLQNWEQYALTLIRPPGLSGREVSLLPHGCEPKKNIERLQRAVAAARAAMAPEWAVVSGRDPRSGQRQHRER